MISLGIDDFRLGSGITDFRQDVVHAVEFILKRFLPHRVFVEFRQTPRVELIAEKMNSLGSFITDKINDHFCDDGIVVGAMKIR